MPATPPSVLLVTLDTVRADHTALFGYERPTTPSLERIAGEGVSFDVAYTMTSTTGPTHATIFTGRYAPFHGVRKNGLALPEPEITLAEHLAARGYRTAAFVGSFAMAGKFGYDQGFERYDDAFEGDSSSLASRVWEGHRVPGRAFDRPGDVTTALAVDWLESLAPHERFFAFVHYFDAHEPYEPIAGHTDRFVEDGAEPSEIDLYDGEIAFVDTQLGALDAALTRLGRRDDTIVVVTTDHGQGLMDHGTPHHGMDLHEESVRAVLSVRWPGRIAPGRVLAGPVEQVDLLPTVLELTDPEATIPPELPGMSLAGALLRDEPLPEERPVHLYRQWYRRRGRIADVEVVGDEYGIRIGRWKYVVGEREGLERLYDLEADPGERRDLTNERPAERERLAAALARWRASRPPPKRSAREPSADDREKLRALGYVD